nr:MAG TPA: hypothetical protein [Bacteriophage sp.]
MLSVRRTSSFLRAIFICTSLFSFSVSSNIVETTFPILLNKVFFALSG